MLNKLARTFVAQMEALKKYRSTGEQTIKVQHVTVNEGGQAIVGTVHTRGGGATEKERRPHEPCRSDEPGSALLGHVEEVTPSLPSVGGEGLDRVPVSRRAAADRRGPLTATIEAVRTPLRPTYRGGQSTLCYASVVPPSKIIKGENCI